MILKQLKEPIVVVTEIPIQTKEVKRLDKWLYDVIKNNDTYREHKIEE